VTVFEKHYATNKRLSVVLITTDIDIVGLIQGIELYHQLHLHRELLNDQKFDDKRIASHDPEVSLSILKSVEIEKKENQLGGKLEPIVSMVTGYSSENITDGNFSLAKYFEDAKICMEKSVEPTTLVLIGSDHVTCVIYDKVNQQWKFIDANNAPKILIFNQADEIAKAVNEGFFKGNTVFKASLWGYQEKALNDAAVEFREEIYAEEEKSEVTAMVSGGPGQN
jgi:hypothetical protein